MYEKHYPDFFIGNRCYDSNNLPDHCYLNNMAVKLNSVIVPRNYAKPSNAIIR